MASDAQARAGGVIGGEPAYSGPFVILRPCELGYAVDVQPSSDGLDRAFTFVSKDAAWRYAADLWTEMRLPFRDETAVSTGRTWADRERD